MLDVLAVRSVHRLPAEIRGICRASGSVGRGGRIVRGSVELVRLLAGRRVDRAGRVDRQRSGTMIGWRRQIRAGGGHHGRPMVFAADRCWFHGG